MVTKYNVSESNQLVSGLQANLANSREVYNNLSQAMGNFFSALLSNQLQGATYASANRYFSQVLNPLVTKGKQIVLDGEGDLKTFTREAKKINDYGDLDKTKLEADKQVKEETKRSAETHLSELNSWKALKTIEPYIYDQLVKMAETTQTQMTKDIKKIDEKLRALETFETNTNELFIDSFTALEAFQRAVVELKNVKISSSGFVTIPDNIFKLISEMDGVKLAAGDGNSYYKGLPSGYRDEIEKIIDSELSATEKADKIASIYEQYLYSLNPEAFKKYDEIRKKYDDEKSFERIKAEEELTKELQKLPIDIREIARMLGDDVISISSKNGFDYMEFYNMVQTNHPLDLKKREFGDSGYSIWSRGWSGNESTDFLGNYLYGYYGQGVLAIGGETLKIAGGVAQIWSDREKRPLKIIGYVVGATLSPIGTLLVWKLKDYGDNAGDGKYIQMGIDDYEKYHKK
ncbi:polymorphic toxin type 44 domain-containing protein [Pseudolactococcus reticulitermitis]|uniref:LXG domain-containing protein n=1 Tax=Pseudolactococcus reticulitermitis TaxID=2025039 RepID=A0A224X708_9LACT|nr:polymorphic toxin type 44 domain-containing protein [Lactococcus reticulitermitis]GAX48326.1 hypothetical protein RsY01_1942 [Lactococcus reticulitermitis]